MPGDDAEKPPVQYEERYCAFIDILGFSELINRLSRENTPTDDLRDLLRVVHAPPRGQNIRSFKGSDIKAQSISDAVCLSAAPSPAGLLHLFHSLEELAGELLEQGFFVRGAVIKGKLYHDNQMVFGEALMRAYRLEQDVVRHPRIMVTSDIAREVHENFMDKQDIAEFSDSLRQAEDGPHYLHVLRTVETTLNFHTSLPPKSPAQKEEQAGNYARFNRMANQIQRRFNESVDTPRHFEKVQWFAIYWNRTLERYRDIVKQIVGPGAAREPGVWG